METFSSAQKESWLSWFLKGILLLGFFILLARAIELQIIKGSYYRDLAEGNRLRTIVIPAPRGKILDRNGKVLVDNKMDYFNFTLTPELSLEAKKADSPNEESIAIWTRHYPLGEKFAHVSGYLGEVNSKEVGKVNPLCKEKGVRKLGSMVGRGGLEEHYDCLLRGIDGEELLEVDTFGKKIRTFARKNPQNGQDLTTTIDIGLQNAVSLRLTGKRGAIVASHPNGEILAIYSSPSYDPNLFASSENQNKNKLQSILDDKSMPLFNRAISGLYHPGSIFKMVTATAALESNVIDKSFTYEDKGIIVVNDFSYTNWYFTQYGRTEGIINLPRAIARSTDTFFYNLGELTGIDAIVEWAKNFGFNEKTGIDLVSESKSLVPSPEWKKAVIGERWFLGNTFHIAIGQGDLLVTPLAANMAVAALIKGELCVPHINADMEKSCKSLAISKENLEIIKEGMKGACSQGGTAYPFFDFTPEVACKTGTAETSKEDTTHAWFTVYAPIDNPEIVLTILVEEGGEGSSEAAPIARDILEYWFRRKSNEN